MLRTPEKISMAGKLSVLGHVVSLLQGGNSAVSQGQDACLLHICGHLTLKTVSPNGQQPVASKQKQHLKCPQQTTYKLFNTILIILPPE